MLKTSAPARFRFADFLLDPADRTLRRGGAVLDLNSRYLDALTLLVREAGRLVPKDRFMDEVWRGVPVTDEALTQCIKTLRRQLGDSAAAPRFIETVPKHGYRFIAPVEPAEDRAAPHQPIAAQAGDTLRLGLAGMVGGGAAGLVGGLVYGFAAAAQAPGSGGGAALSLLLVLLCVTAALATLGGAGVGFGLAAAAQLGDRRWQWWVLGGLGGGLLVGALVKLIALDAFQLLIGRAPGDITGAPEGAVLGAAVGLAAWLANRGGMSVRRSAALAALFGAGAGLLLSVLGGRLLGGSLDLLAQSFPASRLRLGEIGALVGETGFGPATRAVTAMLEAGLFAAGTVVALTLARRRAARGTV